ncbi:MAG: phenylalanine--tRNA ligase subunit beta, partial [Acidobacteria bacterium]
VLERVFSRLGFVAAAAGEGWNVTVPTFRVDISREADLVEEVARHAGYDRIPATFPALREMPARPAPAITRKALVRHVLTAAGFSEAISFTFIESPAAEPFLAADAAPHAELVPLAYPLSEKFAVLRPSLLPGLLDGVAHNRRRESRDVRLFEVGSCFDSSRGEQRRVA